ncbi:MAG: ATP-dependent DNA helicase PcrA, partial [Clostridiales bacterium]|nr:ATP-dependent DNA helicase PcrA [Clostridiales bacterium]
MIDVDTIIQKLNPEQIKPVLDIDGAVLVIAGAGSGKTRVLTSRIAYLIQKQMVDPANIIAITFTNKAAGEMKERLTKMVGGIGDMWVSTIHSMCVRILRRDIDKLGYDKNFSIYDESDKDKALKRVFEELGLDTEKLFKSARNLISDAKNDCLYPEDFKREYAHLHFVNDVYSAYKKYEEVLRQSNSMDFDDLLFKTYELFTKFPEVADYYSNKFRYIHVDEFQDTNTVQFAIIQRLAKTHGNLFVVGDDDQSIYGWRGAKIENILKFDDVFRGAKVYKLQQNYRSTKKILTVANTIIANNTQRRQKELWTDNDEGVRVETFIGTDENNEAGYVAMQIKNLMARSNYTYKDFAVFMRLNAITRALEQEFTKYAIPYKVFGGFRFFERKEVKDVLSYLKLIANPYDDESFIRAIGVPRRGIGDKTLRDLREYSSSLSISLYQAIEHINHTSLSNASKTKLANFKLLIDSFKSFANHNTVDKLIDHVLESTSFMEQFAERSEENHDRIMNISELKNTAEQFVKDNPTMGLSDYLNSMTLSSDTDTINTDETVTLATIHASKGLEYKCVFIVGLDEKILPVARAVDDPDEMEEERRLMYVGVTRAMERLYLTRANSRYMYGKREYMTQSRFLKEAMPVINPAYTKTQFADRSVNGFRYGNDEDMGSSQTFKGGYNSSYAVKTLLNPTQPKTKTLSNPSAYKSGVKVHHAKFGEGTVITVKGSGDNIIVDVAFKG